MLTQGTLIRLLIIALVDITGVIWRKSRGSRWSVGDDRERLHYLLVDRGYRTEQAVKGAFLLFLVLGSLVVFYYHVGLTRTLSYLAFMSACWVYFVVTCSRSQKT